MKVWELIEKLMRLPAGTNVCAQRHCAAHAFDIVVADVDEAEGEDGFVRLIGDGSKPDDDEIEL